MKKDFDRTATRNEVTSMFQGVPVKESDPAGSDSRITINPKEQRTARKMLLLPPSLLKKLDKEAKKNHTSVNNLINLILEAYFEQ